MIVPPLPLAIRLIRIGGIVAAAIVSVTLAILRNTDTEKKSDEEKR